LQDLVGFLGELNAAGCDLYLEKQAVNTTTPAGRALFQMLGVFAEFERAIIQERIHAGLGRARQGHQERQADRSGECWSRAISALIRYTTLPPVPHWRAVLRIPLPLASAARIAASLVASIQRAAIIRQNVRSTLRFGEPRQANHRDLSTISSCRAAKTWP
jgi:hypothetical protein